MPLNREMSVVTQRQRSQLIPPAALLAMLLISAVCLPGLLFSQEPAASLAPVIPAMAGGTPSTTADSAPSANPFSDPLLSAQLIQSDDVRPHIEFLASEELRGRRGRDALRAGDYLKQHFQKNGLKPLFGDSYFQEIPGPKTEDGRDTLYGRNVGAWIPGSDPDLRDEFVIISAHYDHLGERNGEIFRGADDNASGTSMLLETASWFARLDPHPRRSMVFIGFDLEEHLLWGSRWFVAHPPWPVESIRLFITADMIGRSLGNLPLGTVFVMGAEHGAGLPEVLDAIGEPAGLNVARLGIDLVGTRSDYGPFRDQRVPFLFFSTGEHPDYHQATDLPERIDYPQVAAVSSLIARITRTVADSDQPLTWVRDVEPQLSEVRAVHRIAKSLLEADERGTGTLTGFQKFVVSQAELTTRQILDRGTVTPQERSALIRTAQILLLSVF